EERAYDRLDVDEERHPRRLHPLEHPVPHRVTEGGDHHSEVGGADHGGSSPPRPASPRPLPRPPAGPWPPPPAASTTPPRSAGRGGGEDVPSDQRVGGVGEPGEHEQEVTAPVGGNRHAEPRYAVQDHEGGPHDRKSRPHELPTREPLAKKKRREQDEGDGLH